MVNDAGMADRAGRASFPSRRVRWQVAAVIADGTKIAVSTLNRDAGSSTCVERLSWRSRNGETMAQLFDT
jgi:hypothetical protein